MGKRSGAADVFGKMLLYVVVVLVILGIAGGIAYFALRGSGVTFYVEYNGERYFSNTEDGNIQLVRGKKGNFSVKSLIGNDVNYTVSITSNPANDFTFKYNDEYYWFYSDDESLNDYTQYFDIERNADGFELYVPFDFSVEALIEQKYGGDVEISNSLNDSYRYFGITVTVDESAVNLWFMVYDFSVTPSNLFF